MGKRGDFVKFELIVPLFPNLTKPACYGRKTSLPAYARAGLVPAREPRRAQLGVGQGDLIISLIAVPFLLKW